MHLDEHMKSLALARKFLDEECLPLVDKDKRDARLVAYRLADACATRATSALASWSFGDVDAAVRTSRFIHECRLLVTSLARLPDEACIRYAKQFFRDGRITIDVRKYRKELSVGTGLSRKGLEEWLEKINELNRSFAKGNRTDFHSLARGFDADLFMPNLYATPPAPGDHRTFDFGKLIIAPLVCTIDAALSSLRARTEEDVACKSECDIPK